MEYCVFSDYSELPKNKRITVIDVPFEDKEEDCPCAGIINIFDYYRGKMVPNTLDKYDIAEISDRILNYPYREEVYLHEDAQLTYGFLLENTGIFFKGKGDPEEIDKILKELGRIYSENDEDDFDIT